MNKYIDSAIKVLSKSNIPLHSKTITELALSKWYLKSDWKTPDESMWSIIRDDVNKKWKNSYFIKTEPWYFKLNKNININTEEKSLAKNKEYTTDELELIFSLCPTKDNVKKLAKILNRSERAIEQQYQWAMLSDKAIDIKNKENDTNWNKNMKCREISKKLWWLRTY